MTFSYNMRFFPWISAFPASDVIIGCSFLVAKVYTWPVSDATRSITCVPVSVDNS